MLIEILKPGKVLSFFLTLKKPVCSHYGGKRIFTEKYGNLSIINHDITTQTLKVCELEDETKILNFQLVHDAESDKDLYTKYIIKRWLECRDRWVQDSDFVDYLPAFYENFKAMDADKMQIYDGQYVCFDFSFVCFLDHVPLTCSASAA